MINMMTPLKSEFFDFRAASLLLYRKRLFSKKNIDSDKFIPYVVNGSFCIEIGLKAILHENNKEFKKEHSLIKLFELLDDYEKDFLLKKIVSFGNSVDDSMENLKLLLNSISLNFTEWRYYYEKMSFSLIGFLYMILLKRLLLDLVQNLRIISLEC